MGAQHLFRQLHQVVETAGDLQGGRSGNHRQDDEHDADRRLGRRAAEDEREERYAEPADQAEGHPAPADTDQHGPEYQDELNPEHCHETPP